MKRNHQLALGFFIGIVGSAIASIIVNILFGSYLPRWGLLVLTYTVVFAIILIAWLIFRSATSKPKGENSV